LEFIVSLPVEVELDGEAVVSELVEDDGDEVVPLEGDVVEVAPALPLTEPLLLLCDAAAPAGLAG